MPFIYFSSLLLPVFLILLITPIRKRSGTKREIRVSTQIGSIRNVENQSYAYEQCGEPTPRISTHATFRENIPPYVSAELLTLSKIMDTNLL